MEKLSYLPNLADLAISEPRLQQDEGIEFDLEALLGISDLALGEFVLRVRLKRCYVQLVCERATIIPGTRYGAVLQKYSYQEVQETTTTRGRTDSATASAEAEAKFFAWVPSLAGSLKASGNLNANNARTNKTEQIRRPEVALITPVPSGRWLIGDQELGDIRKPDGCLHGSYFREAHAEGVNQLAPLCVLRVDRKTKMIIPLYVAVVVRPHDFRFDLVNSWGDNAGDVPSTDQEIFHQRLKARIAGIALTKQLSAAHTKFAELLENNELVICLAAAEWRLDDVRRKQQQQTT